MSFIAAVTQPAWIEVLRRFGAEGQVNFWRPSRSGFSSRNVGQKFVFVVKGKWPREIAGYGTVLQYENLPVRSAWDRWTFGNGVDSLNEFKARLEKVLRATHSNVGSRRRLSRGNALPEQVTDDYSIGCIVLKDLVLFPPGSYREDRVLSGFPKNLVHYAVMKTQFPFDSITPNPEATRETAIARERQSSYSTRVLSEEERQAIERRATEVCRQSFAQWDVKDVSTSHLALAVVGTSYPGYDFLARLDGTEVHLEVKGTTSDVPVVKITTNELRHAAEDKRARLLVVKCIVLQAIEGQVAASGGSPSLYRWRGRHNLVEIFDLLSAEEHEHHMTLAEGQWEINVENTDLLEADHDLPATIGIHG